MTVTINIEALKACIPFMGQDASRPYLSVVLVTGGLLVAVDGRNMIVIRPKIFAGTAGDFMLPSAVVKQVCKCKPSVRKLPLFVSVDLERSAIDLRQTLPCEKHPDARIQSSFSFLPGEGNFPDWRRIIPSLEDLETPAGLNANTVALRSFESLGSVISIYPNKFEKAPCLARAETEYFSALGLMMPLQTSSIGERIPAWISQPGLLALPDAKEALAKEGAS